MYIGKVALTLVAVALLTGCPSSSDGDGPGDERPALTQFNGTYAGNCQRNFEQVGVWETAETTIQSDSASFTINVYTDSACTQIDQVLLVTASLSYPGGTANTALGEATFIDSTIETASVNGTPSQQGVGTELFDLILLDDNNLYFGLEVDGLDGSTPEARATEIDLSNPVVRIGGGGGSNSGDELPALTQFDGTYFESCRADSDEVGIWFTEEFVIQSLSTRSIRTEYTDALCTQINVTEVITASIAYPGGTVSTPLGVANFADLTIETFTSNGVTDQRFIGLNFFDLILLDGDTLYFGLFTDQLDGLASEARPIEIDLSVPAVRTNGVEDTNSGPPELTQFDGTYFSSCQASPNDPGFWSTIENTLQSGTLRFIRIEYTDAACTQVAASFELFSSIAFPGGTSNTALGVADFLDITEEELIINGLSIPLTGVASFDLILVSNGTLYLGLETTELNGTSAATRPTQIDTSAPFVRM